VLIIGGGIIGLAIGYYLSKRNISDVEIIERDPELTMHASGHNAGGLAGAHESQRRELWPLFREGRLLYRELAQSNGFSFDYATGGTLSPSTIKEMNNLEKTGNTFTDEAGAKIEFLDSADLQKMEPNLSTSRFNCAIYYPEDAQGNSKKLGQCFAGICLESGMEISTGSEVISFEIDHGTVSEVRTTRGTIIPKTAILAAGPWTGQISAKLGLQIPVEPVKGHLISIESDGLKLVNSFIDGPRYYVMQNGSSIVVGGGEDSVGFDTAVDPARLADAWQEGVSMVPKLASMNQESRTACLRPFAPGGLPILGKTMRLDNVIFATGHYKNGFGLAPVTGKLISQLVADGETGIDISPFSPDRFDRNGSITDPV